MFRKFLLVISTAFLFAAMASAQGSTTPAATSTTAAATEPVKKPAIFRPNKDQILEVQKILKTKKLYNGEADGKYNDDTRTGIKSFQKDNGLKETGTLNRATLEKFGVKLTDKQKEIPVSPGSFADGQEGRGKTSPASTSSTPKTTEIKTMSSTTNETAAEPAKKPAPFRANADQIKAAQKILIDGKMYTGEQTGKLDDPTRDGLKKYQEAKGMKVTGTLNAVTLEKMGIALTDAQKANVAAAAAPAPKN